MPLTDNMSIVYISDSSTALIVSQMYKLIRLFVIILRIAYYVLIFHRGRQCAFVLPNAELLSIFLIVALCCAIILCYFCLPNRTRMSCVLSVMAHAHEFS